MLMPRGPKGSAGDPMNEQLAMALGLMCVCSAAFAAMLPRLAIAVGRGQFATAIRVSAVMATLVAITLVAAAGLGASPAAYSVVS
ncbi:hypothetical protein GCM10022200_25250 [Microbacterium awajiense]|uniref:Uncharacterized protein n=2 Tax=Microbacterium awajiense TaxID=415214 RepID=A0ABP7AUQ1_9MICO